MKKDKHSICEGQMIIVFSYSEVRNGITTSSIKPHVLALPFFYKIRLPKECDPLFKAVALVRLSSPRYSPFNDFTVHNW